MVQYQETCCNFGAAEIPVLEPFNFWRFKDVEKIGDAWEFLGLTFLA